MIAILRWVSALPLLAAILWLPPENGQKAAPVPEVPKAHDPRLVVELFVAAPDIVHPVSLDFDAKGRLLVIESHTHFPPKDYTGPKHDRIRVLEDTDGDGKADRFTTFHEETKATMDLAVHAEGSVYVATRNEVLRLRDTDGDGKADQRERLVFLDTKGDYPHNGLSGLCFDAKGNFYFGMGENLGVTYKLVGADGATLTGEGEGGNVFWCTADGNKLRRVATGFWNPFGVCRDILDRIFVVDNDPDAMPPCRLLHLVEGGDYGYQFRYGRSGRHVFQAWNGQLPGTLPMVTGTGESPCEVLSYESDGLPREYLGSLLVTAWADHRIERYILKEQGASFTAERKSFVQGGKDFRPVGLAVAPDGSLFVSDWVLRDYTLHGCGAIWHIRRREARKPERELGAEQALFSMHRPLRESAARFLAADEAGRVELRRQLTHADVRVRAASLGALLVRDDPRLDLHAVANKDAEMGLRALAVRALAERGADVRRYLQGSLPVLTREAVVGLRGDGQSPLLVELLNDADSFVRHAAVHQLARHEYLMAGIDVSKPVDPRQRVGLLLAHRASGHPDGRKRIPRFLADPDEDVRFLAAKWISDEKLIEYRPLLIAALKDRKLNVRMYAAYATALARVDGKEVNEASLADYFLERIADAATPADRRRLALQQVPAAHKKLTVSLLGKLLTADDPALQREAVRALAEHPDAKRQEILLDAARDGRRGDEVRAHALAGLAERAELVVDDLLWFATNEKAILRDEALRSLTQTKLTVEQRKRLEELARNRPETADLVARVLGRPFSKDRSPASNVAAWLQRLDGPADAAAGQRVFAHPRLAACARCHRAEGRGQEIGPDLSTIGRTERRSILESLLQPSNNVAPHYQAWVLATADGRLRTGMLVHTNLDEYTYLDEKGDQFKLNTRDIVESRPAPQSIMPEGLVDLLTDQEVRDLLAYLSSLR